MGKNFLSLDIGGTRIKHALIDRSGTILEKGHVETPDHLENFLAVISDIIASYQNIIRGVAVSCPGKIDSREGVIYFGGSLRYLHLLNLPKFIKSKFQLPSIIVNDGKAAALSELWLGNLKGIDQGVALILGTGVGGGVVLNGKILMGHHFQAGEFSFAATPSDYLEMKDLVGVQGSAVEMIRDIATALDLEDKTDGKAVFQYILQKDERAYPLFISYCRKIAYLIFNIQSVIDVQRFVIGGGISAQKILIEEISRQYSLLVNENELVAFMHTPPEIFACKFQNEANLLGALYQLLLHFDEPPKF